MQRHSSLRFRCAVSLLGWLLLSSTTASADSVVMKDGTVLTGVVTVDSPDAVAIRSGGNDWVFSRSEVTSVRIDRATRSGEHPVATTQKRDRKAAAADTKAEDAHVVLYGTSWCGYCAKARSYFREHQIPFVDRDVEHDTDANEEVSRKCSAAGSRFNGGVPVIDVNGTIIHGFDEARIERALRSHG